ncbi:MAG: putative holin-like toxin [Lachnospiraceae bacterium]|nr:putative holin-like toxin [Lachnospiraceae bacterium]MDE7424502.1 putative holin-like toxin [Lachnospiraceae bacterium]
MHMSTFESIYLMLTFATFIIALLAYIDKRK